MKEIKPLEVKLDASRYSFSASVAGNDIVTRAMLAAKLYGIEGKPETARSFEAEDIDEDAWYYPAVEWASAIGIINGYGD